METRELARSVYLRMKLLARETKTCVTPFSDLTSDSVPTVKDVIKAIQWLEHRNIIEFVKCDEKICECDYVNVYTIWEWRG